MRALFFLAFLLGTAPLFGDDITPPPTTPPPAASRSEEADIDKIREQYWARGREGAFAVVQNRNHPRHHRLELGVLGGILFGDPALSIQTAGASLGYHLSELLSIHALYLKAFVKPSSVLRDLQDRGLSADFNGPRHYLSAEARVSVAYGKLALGGTRLVYLDTSFAFGGGHLTTESGASAVFSAGIGQHFHMGQSLSLNLDYRLLAYRETIPGRIPGPSGTQGQTFGPRTNLSHGINLGLSFFFNLGGSDSLPAN